MVNNCPICGSPMKYEGDHEDYVEFCSKNKCYSDGFSYGATRITVFDKEFYASYTFDDQEWENFQKEVDEAVEYWKNNEKYLIKLMGV